MKVISPVAVNDTTLIRTNVPEDDAPEYNPATTYALGDTVIVAADNTVYESLQAGNTGNTPSTSPTWWLNIGATHPWRMFDKIIGSVTTDNEVIPGTTETGVSFDVKPATRFNSLAAFGLDAEYIDVYVWEVLSHVTNGTFDTDTDWTKGTGWTIGSGVASHAAGTASDLEQTLTGLTIGTSYLYEAEITAYSGSGNVTPYVDATAGTALASTGLLSMKFTATATSHTIKINAASTAVVDIDNAKFNAITYDSTFFVGDDLSQPDWYYYFFEEIDRADSLTVTDLPLSATADTIRVNGRKSSADITIGELAIGLLTTLGTSVFGVSIGIKDYSRKETDSYGNFIIQERQYSDTMEADFYLDTDTIYAVRKALAALRTTPCVWIAEESYKETVIYGYYKDFDIIISGPVKSDASIQIEGLI